MAETAQGILNAYGIIARHWAFGKDWMMRPWTQQQFPKPPRSRISDPFATDDDRLHDLREYEAYQLLCKKIRAVIKTFPDILRDPVNWRRCISAGAKQLSVEDAIQVAKEAAMKWVEPDDLVEFEVREESWFISGVNFIRRGRKLGFTRENVIPDGNKGAIFHVESGAVKVKLPFTMRDYEKALPRAEASSSKETESNTAQPESIPATSPQNNSNSSGQHAETEANP